MPARSPLIRLTQSVDNQFRVMHLVTVHLAQRLAIFAFTLLIVVSLVDYPCAQQPRSHNRYLHINSSLELRSTHGQQSTLRPDARQTRPRLVLLVVVDQFRYDYLERFSELFVANGLRRLMRDGAWWTSAAYDHIPTSTAPGHATLMTGTWPAENGIIGNEWFDRETGRSITSVSDDTAKLLGGEEAGKAASPRRLLASTLGDELRLATQGRSKVIGISSKDRGAILTVGRQATAAYWFSARTGRVVSSNYYFAQLPQWVTNFNNTRPADKYFGARWDRLLPEADYTRLAGPDAPEWEKIGQAKDTNTFPHTITGGGNAPGPAFYDEVAYSPFANDLLIAFAEQAIANEQLGQDDDPDILALSLSANDYVGHRFGPYSQEAMDITLRTDRQLAELLNRIDASIGLQHTVVVFTADHGVAPIPEHAMALNLPGGRVKTSAVLDAVRAQVNARFTPENGESQNAATRDYIQTFSNGSIYFNTALLKRDRINREEIERVAGDAAMTVPGIARYFTRTQLEAGRVAVTDPVARRALHAFHPQRSGDVVLVCEPFKFFGESSTIGTTHGSPYSYDTHVPLIIMGGGVKAGRYRGAASPADIAPTLAAILRVQPPSNTTGRVLTESLSEK